MNRLFHKDIFYPSDQTELEKLTEPTIEKRQARVFLLPHLSLDRASALYRQVFSMLPPTIERVLVLLPIHQPLLESEEDTLYALSGSFIDTPLGRVNLDSLDLPSADNYQEEEPSGELLLPYLARYCSKATATILYSKAETAKEVRKLENRLSKLIKDPHTAVFVSSNLTGRIYDGKLEEEKARAISLLENGDDLLDLYRRKKISLCATPLIEVVNRALDNRKWILLSDLEDTTTGHASFYKELT